MNIFRLIDLDDTVCRTTQDLRGDRTRLRHLTLFEDAMEYLYGVPEQRVLVTAGDVEYQRVKVAHLHIATQFAGVYYCEKPEDKKALFASILSEHRVDPSVGVVIGDRVDTDIRYGNELGMRTVRIRRPGGKYALQEPGSPIETPNVTVSTFTEMLAMLRGS